MYLLIAQTVIVVMGVQSVMCASRMAVAVVVGTSPTETAVLTKVSPISLLPSLNALPAGIAVAALIQVPTHATISL